MCIEPINHHGRKLTPYLMMFKATLEDLSVGTQYQQEKEGRSKDLALFSWPKEHVIWI